jgi:MATE family multidrug resistance protein
MKKIFSLALPVSLQFLGLMSLGLVDLIIVGQLGPVATGAVGIGTSAFYWPILFGLGMLAGLDYQVSTSFGAGSLVDCHRSLGQGLWIAITLSLPFIAVIYYSANIITLFDLNPEVLPLAQSFLHIIAWSAPPFFIFAACNNYLRAIGIVKAPLVVLVIANLLNFFLDCGFVLGNWGFPKLGSDGCAVATVLSRYLMAALLLTYIFYWTRRHSAVPIRLKHFAWLPEKGMELIKLGFPSAMQMTLEAGVFSLSTIFAGRLTTHALAAHQIVLNIASFTFMVPMGIGAATAVLVGQNLGAGEPRKASLEGWKGLSLGAAFMLFSAVILLVFSSELILFFTNDGGVLLVAKEILFVAAIFQISDGVQTVLTGALRGLGDTQTALYANLAGHWIVGLPLGLFLGFGMKQGISGIWTGLAVGLFFVAVILTVAWKKKTQGVAFLNQPSPII